MLSKQWLTMHTKLFISTIKKLTAAVFPYPEMADHMVRQRWDKWNIDEVYPMIYHNFIMKKLIG
jgi:hypothetical protein